MLLAKSNLVPIIFFYENFLHGKYTKQAKHVYFLYTTLENQEAGRRLLWPSDLKAPLESPSDEATSIDLVKEVER